MARTTKVLGFSVPPELADEFEVMAQSERRTKSELFREMVRLYQRYRTCRTEFDDAWVMQTIQEAKETPMTEEELLRESAELAAYGAERARSLGYDNLDAEAVEHIINET